MADRTSINRPSKAADAFEDDIAALNRAAELAALCRLVRTQDRALLRSQRKVFALSAQVAALQQKQLDVNDQRNDLARQVEDLLSSSSWRVTAPLRLLARFLRSRRRS
ncbi:hypothetical protein [Paracoccus beibuensis]|uniref:hypothetical protein n=1 Tax=Paracoccus beibuensis TaxID=547602 RepID=UPI002240036C|nr:hypothetical protein [Paracoccus beibuensis]